MSQDLYQEAIIEELKHPQNKRVLTDAAVSVHETNASCGDDMTVFLKFDASGQQIAEVGWQGSGCAISQATMSLLSEKITQMRVSDVLTLQQSDLEALLGLEQPIAYGRVKCLLLGLQAVKKSIAHLEQLSM
jgi:nitrogen fixation NifU-like protein